MIFDKDTDDVYPKKKQRVHLQEFHHTCLA
jgi:hypothetical protein